MREQKVVGFRGIPFVCVFFSPLHRSNRSVKSRPVMVMTSHRKEYCCCPLAALPAKSYHFRVQSHWQERIQVLLVLIHLFLAIHTSFPRISCHGLGLRNLGDRLCWPQRAFFFC
jgi:hypothetical protein